MSSIFSRNDKIEQLTYDYDMTSTADVHIGTTATCASLVGKTSSAGTIRNKIVEVSHFGNHMLSVDDYAFTGCVNLTAVSCCISAHPGYIGSHSFDGCTSLDKFSIFDDGLSVFCLDDFAFANSGLNDVKLNLVGMNYTSDDEYEGCVITEKSGGPYLGESVFESCTQLKSVKFLKSNEIGTRMFYGCTSLSDV